MVTKKWIEIDNQVKKYTIKYNWGADWLSGLVVVPASKPKGDKHILNGEH